MKVDGLNQSEEQGHDWSLRDAGCLLLLGLWSLVYIFGGSTTIQPADSADFLTSVGLMGVAHPPGYPLYTMLGILVSKSLPFSIPVSLSILAALLSVGLLWGIYCVVKLLTQHRLAAFCAAWIAATSHHIWHHATHPEVFTLLGFFAIWLLFFSIRVTQATRTTQQRTRDWFSYALLAGLASAHHQTIIFTFPIGLLLLFHLLFCRTTKLPKAWTALALGVVFFVVGLLPYSYLLVRGDKQMIGSWGHIHNIKTFTDHMLRRVYGTFRSGGKGTKNARFGYHAWRYGKLSVDPLGTFPFGLSLFWLLGVFVILRQVVQWRWSLFPPPEGTEDERDPRGAWLWLSLLVTFVLVGPFFLSLLHHGETPVARYVVGRFFLLPDVFLSVFSGVGLAIFFRWVVTFWSNRTDSDRLLRLSGLSLLLGSFLVVSLFAFGFQASRSSSKGRDWMQRYMVDLLKELPKDSLLLVPGDDVICFGIPYLQQVRNIRPDVRFVCRSFLSEGWYFQQRLRAWPELRKNWSSPIISSFSIMKHYLKMGRPVHISSLYHRNLRKAFGIEPYGLSFRVVSKEKHSPNLRVIENQMLRRFRNMASQLPLPQEDKHPWSVYLLRKHYLPPWLFLSSLYRQKKDIQSAKRCLYYAKRWYLLPKRKR